MSADEPDRIEAILRVAARIATTTPSGRVLLARIAAQLDPDWVPEAMRARVSGHLETALDATAEPLRRETVEAILQQAWGAPASDELDELDPEPVAVTPTAQVHRATLAGAPVAIKVLRPGLSAAVRRDLVLLEGALAPLAAVLPQLDGLALVHEARERILDEFDLEHEATVQRRFARALRRHPVLSVPAPVSRLAGEQVLVSEWVDGTPISRMPAGPERELAAVRLAGFVLGGAREGVMHAGADLDDALLTPAGKLAVLDFGSACAVPAAGAELAQQAVDAFVRRSGDALGTALDGLGLLPPACGPAALALLETALGELGGEAPTRLDLDALAGVGRRIASEPAGSLELLAAARLPAEHLWPLRAVGQLGAALARLGVTAAWPELVARSLRDGWAAVS